MGLVEDAVVDMLNQGEKLLSKAKEEARVHAEAQAQEITDLTSRAEGLEERIKRLENQILEYQNRVETQTAEAVQVRQDWLERERNLEGARGSSSRRRSSAWTPRCRPRPASSSP